MAVRVGHGPHWHRGPESGDRLRGDECTSAPVLSVFLILSPTFSQKLAVGDVIVDTLAPSTSKSGAFLV